MPFMLLRRADSVPSDLPDNTEILRFESATTVDVMRPERLYQFQRNTHAVYESLLVSRQGDFSCQELQPIQQGQHDFILKIFL